MKVILVIEHNNNNNNNCKSMLLDMWCKSTPNSQFTCVEITKIT